VALSDEGDGTWAIADAVKPNLNSKTVVGFAK
jgi:hypothetical protein